MHKVLTTHCSPMSAWVVTRIQNANLQVGHLTLTARVTHPQGWVVPSRAGSAVKQSLQGCWVLGLSGFTSTLCRLCRGVLSRVFARVVRFRGRAVVVRHRLRRCGSGALSEVVSGLVVILGAQHGPAHRPRSAPWGRGRRTVRGRLGR